MEGSSIFDTVSLLYEPLLSYDQWVSKIEELSKMDGKQFSKTLINHSLGLNKVVRGQIIANLMQIKNRSKSSHTSKLINQWIEGLCYRFQDLEVCSRSKAEYKISNYNKTLIMVILIVLFFLALY